VRDGVRGCRGRAGGGGGEEVGANLSTATECLLPTCTNKKKKKQRHGQTSGRTGASVTECMPASVLSDGWGVSRGACLHVHLRCMHGSNTHHPPAMTVMRVCPGSPWFGNVQLSNTTPSTSCLCPLINTGPTHDMAIDMRQKLQSAMAMDVLLGPMIQSTHVD
jgi:hypothetical protein